MIIMLHRSLEHEVSPRNTDKVAHKASGKSLYGELHISTCGFE